jgi:hypothetical protein
MMDMMAGAEENEEKGFTNEKDVLKSEKKD